MSKLTATRIIAVLVCLVGISLMSKPYQGPNMGASNGLHVFGAVDDSRFGICLDISGYEWGVAW